MSFRQCKSRIFIVYVCVRGLIYVKLNALLFSLQRSKTTPREHPMNSYGGHFQESRDRYSPLKGRPDAYSPVKANDALQTNRREVFSPDKRDTYTPAKRDMRTPQKTDPYSSQRRDTYTPQKRDTYSAQKRDTYTPQKRDTLSAAKREIYSSDKRTYSPLKAPVNNYPTEKDYQKPGRHVSVRFIAILFE